MQSDLDRAEQYKIKDFLFIMALATLQYSLVAIEMMNLFFRYH